MSPASSRVQGRSFGMDAPPGFAGGEYAGRDPASIPFPRFLPIGLRLVDLREKAFPGEGGRPLHGPPFAFQKAVWAPPLPKKIDASPAARGRAREIESEFHPKNGVVERDPPMTVRAFGRRHPPALGMWVLAGLGIGEPVTVDLVDPGDARRHASGMGGGGLKSEVRQLSIIIGDCRTGRKKTPCPHVRGRGISWRRGKSKSR